MCNCERQLIQRNQTNIIIHTQVIRIAWSRNLQHGRFGSRLRGEVHTNVSTKRKKADLDLCPVRRAPFAPFAFQRAQLHACSRTPEALGRPSTNRAVKPAPSGRRTPGSRAKRAYRGMGPRYNEPVLDERRRRVLRSLALTMVSKF